MNTLRDEVSEGKLYSRSGLTVHHFCLLFASALVQVRGTFKKNLNTIPNGHVL